MTGAESYDEYAEESHPWAVDSQSLGRFGLVEILVFAASVLVPFIYLVANGALDWGPVKRVRCSSRRPSAPRRRRCAISGRRATKQRRRSRR